MRPERYLILSSMTLLIAIGSVAVFSSTLIVPGSEDVSLLATQRHLAWIAIGVAACLAANAVGVRRLEKWHKQIGWATLGILVLVLIPGVGSRINGAQRWIRPFGGFGFQPSELAKIGLLIYVSASISALQGNLNNFRRGVLPILGLVGTCVGLVLVEPDVGTAMFLGGLCLSLFLISGVELKRFLPVMAIAGVLLVVVAVAKFDHVQHRLNTWLNPTADQQGKGYQIHQAKIAFGSGGLLGDGIGAGTQKLFYLPAKSTDFILAIIGEEMGFFGVALVIGLFIAFIFGGMKLCLRCPDLYTCLLACGLTLMVGMQALANIAVVTGTVPTKGISLPFVSFGGSNMVISMLGVGLLYNIGGLLPGARDEDEEAYDEDDDLVVT